MIAHERRTALRTYMRTLEGPLCWRLQPNRRPTDFMSFELDAERKPRFRGMIV